MSLLPSSGLAGMEDAAILRIAAAAISGGWRGRVCAAGGDFALPILLILRGLKNKPKFRCYASFTPKFSLLFHRSKGRVGLFRALRADLRICGDRNGLPLDHNKLLKKFDQNFQKKSSLKLQTPIYRSLLPPTTENFLLFYILFKKISHNG